MFELLLNKLGLLNVLYIKVKKNHVYVKDVWGNNILEGTDELIIDANTNKVLEVGGIDSGVTTEENNLKKRVHVFENTSNLEPLKDEIEALLKYYIRKVTQRTVLIRPVIVFQILDNALSSDDYQKNILSKMLFNVGAREVCILGEGVRHPKGTG